MKEYCDRAHTRIRAPHHLRCPEISLVFSGKSGVGRAAVVHNRRTAGDRVPTATAICRRGDGLHHYWRTFHHSCTFSCNFLHNPRNLRHIPAAPSSLPSVSPSVSPSSSVTYITQKHTS